MSTHQREDGFSLVEVMIAMVISGVTLMGTMGAIEISSRHVQQGQVSTRALDLAEARLEAKRSIRWQAMLEDDLDHDGVVDVTMKDDGQGPDRVAGDGIYTAMHEQDGVKVVWAVEADRPGAIASANSVAIHATAFYPGRRATQNVHLATLRSNPDFVGLP